MNNVVTFVSGGVQKLDEKEGDENARFRHSLNIINSLVNDNTHDKQSILSAIRNLSCSGYETTYGESEKLHKIVNSLIDKYNCSETELRSAFANVYVTWFHTNCPESGRAAKYLGDVKAISFESMMIDVNATLSVIESLRLFRVKQVRISKCHLKSSSSDGVMCSQNVEYHASPSHTIREFMVVYKCTFQDEKSFVNVIKWGTSSSCGQFRLIRIDVKFEWWWKFVDIIEKQTNRCKIISLDECAPAITMEMKRKV